MITINQLKQIIKEAILQYYTKANVVNGMVVSGRFPVYKKFGVPYSKPIRKVKITATVVNALQYDQNKRH